MADNGPGGLPVIVEVGEGRLHVLVHAHEVVHGGNDLRCWTYVTRGLWPLGQPELSLTLVRRAGEGPEAFPRGPIDLFDQIQGFAAAGRVVGPGEMTELGESGFLGRPALRAVAYLDHQPVPGVATEGPALTAILLLDEERQAARLGGLTRVAARLGQAFRHWPCPFWSDRDRAPVVSADEPDRSILAQFPSLFLPGASATLHGGTHVELAVPETARALLRDQIPTLGPEIPIALLCRLDEAADGCLVWHPGQQAPAAITPPGLSSAARMGGAFCAFVPQQGADEGRLFEDGFVIMLTDARWQILRDALASAREAAFPAAVPALSFALRWRAAARHLH